MKEFSQLDPEARKRFQMMIQANSSAGANNEQSNINSGAGIHDTHPLSQMKREPHQSDYKWIFMCLLNLYLSNLLAYIYLTRLNLPITDRPTKFSERVDGRTNERTTELGKYTTYNSILLKITLYISIP